MKHKLEVRKNVGLCETRWEILGKSYISILFKEFHHEEFQRFAANSLIVHEVEKIY